MWPGSQAIAKAKAFTANAFSNDPLALSTARLYTFIQPGHSLYGLNNSNPFNPDFLAPPSGQGGGTGEVAGGIITFGGGVPLYSSRGHIVGGLGLSGDTACTDHESAKRVRDEAGLNPPGGSTVDDIQYSAVDPASPFIHPLCPNTFATARSSAPSGTRAGTERVARTKRPRRGDSSGLPLWFLPHVHSGGLGGVWLTKPRREFRAIPGCFALPCRDTDAQNTA